MSKVVLITGASSGIGRCCFEYLSAQGLNVYGTSRKDDGRDKMLQMDVQNPDSIAQAVQQVIDQEGRIDVLLNNAGISIVGAIEDTSADEIQQIMDTNFMGAVRMTQAVLPAMRAQKAGLIINISSLAGLFAIPYQAFYSASKYAIEGFTESLRMEVKPFNIKACLIEPGDFKTEISANRIFTEQSKAGSVYAKGFQAASKVIVGGEAAGDNPEKIAQLVHRIIKMNNPRVRYRIGKPLDLLAAILKPILPQMIFERLIENHYGL